MNTKTRTEELADLMAARERMQREQHAGFNPAGQNQSGFRSLSRQIGELTVKIEAARKGFTP